MPFDWKNFVDLASELQKRANSAGNAESMLRTALSRAYFGAFCYVRNHATVALGFQARNDPDDHGRLRAHLKGKRSGIAQKLDRLRQWRNDGDYLDELKFDLPTVVTAAIGEAERVFSSLAPSKK
jgi:hypothetical protein